MSTEKTEQHALDFATRAHGDQKRKYRDELFIEHIKRVADLIKSIPHTSEMIQAAYLHDVVEDTPISLKEIKKRFGSSVAGLVAELTDEFTKEKYPHLNRRWRKVKETRRIAGISYGAKTIKLADIIDNLPSVSQNDPGFANRYVPEMAALVEVLSDGDPTLLQRSQEEVSRAKLRLGKLKDLKK